MYCQRTHSHLLLRGKRLKLPALPGLVTIATRITDSTRKLDRRSVSAALQLETEPLITEVDDLADQVRGIGLRECQDSFEIRRIAGNRIGTALGVDIPGELTVAA